MTNKAPLAPTSAYVLRMGMEIYKEPTTLKYLANVDMSSGDSLYRQNPYPIYILNRKFFIRETLLKILKASPIPIQLVVIAAGVDPMPLEILSLVPDKIAHVFEVDVAFMSEKQKLYKSITPQWADRISCITMDIASPDLVATLKNKYGYMPRVPTIVQMEGITYYITTNNIQTILGEFANPDYQSKIIADYLLPYDQISLRAQENGKRIFGSITSETGFSRISQYSLSDFQRILTQVGGTVVDHKTSYELEGQRTGKHDVITRPEDGLCELLVGSF